MMNFFSVIEGVSVSHCPILRAQVPCNLFYVLVNFIQLSIPYGIRYCFILSLDFLFDIKDVSLKVLMPVVHP